MALLAGQATYDEVALPHGEKFKSWDVDQSVLLPTSMHEVGSYGLCGALRAGTGPTSLDLSATLNT
ncbi:hypothetical protein [Nitrospira sp. BLG_1]|uniref:hypothetical protein n=1 Tax=Nitrospira sp. BLG_1 TaxID=3395883 RepID=UPI0039BD59D2